MQQIVVGLDSSCYTTSVAAVSLNGDIICDWRRLLVVKEGELGLRQREALFQHWKNFPDLLNKFRQLPHLEPVAIAYSEKPSGQPGSYLPVFTAATSLAQSIAAVLDVPALPFTHQEGHVAAGRIKTACPLEDTFLAVHLSGGTTELLQVKRKTSGFEIRTLGKTLDLNAGQFVDRVGVALGLPFPAGAHLEQMALSQTEHSITLPSFTKGYNISFSGPQAAAQRLIDTGVDQGAIAQAVLRCIANSVEKILRAAVRDFGTKEVLLVGGVTANTLIRKRLIQRLEHKAVGAKLFFATPGLSTDNAVGIAWLGLSAVKGVKP